MRGRWTSRPVHKYFWRSDEASSDKLYIRNLWQVPLHPFLGVRFALGESRLACLGLEDPRNTHASDLARIFPNQVVRSKKRSRCRSSLRTREIQFLKEAPLLRENRMAFSFVRGEAASHIRALLVLEDGFALWRSTPLRPSDDGATAGPPGAASLRGCP